MEASTEFEGHAPADGGDQAGNCCCCPFYHEAVELVGRRWTGAILRVLMERPMRFSEVVQAVPDLSDRLLSERMKELEARGLVERTVYAGRPLRVEYALTRMGFALGPAVGKLHVWAQRWLAVFEPAPVPRTDQSPTNASGVPTARR